ncbi:MAG: DUF4358 domain-containing protein [Bacilli bacterium]
MKKILLILFGALLLVGCTSKNIVIDLDAVDREIKETEELFGALVKPSKDNLKTYYNIDTTLFEEYSINLPMMNTQANMYMIVKPKKGKEDEVEKMLDDYIYSVEDTFKTYLVDQAKLADNALEEDEGDYMIYIISLNNQDVYNIIKKHITKK